MEFKKVGAIILAAGSGQRMGGIDKLFALLGDKPLLAWSVDACERCSLIEQIVIALNGKNWELGQKLKEERGWCKVSFCLGGARRQDSVKEALNLFQGQLKDCDLVMVHDGARPFLTLRLIEDGLKMAMETGAAVAAVPAKDTIKLVGDNGIVKETLPRHKLWVAQTPQIFRFDLLARAYKELFASCHSERSEESGNAQGRLKDEITDDAAAVERSGYKVKLYMGDYNNIKVTTPEDLALAETIAGKSGVKNLSSMRVGIGYDSHALASERKLILGGVDIPHNMGLLGWSDADVVIHAIIDALCGAAGLGDIGTLFPPEEPEYQNISSLVLLTETDKLARAKGFTVVNIDATIMAQYPKLSPFIPEMKKRISQALGIESSQVTIKATTTNGLGFIGRGEGMAAQSVALVEG